jgi:hypothetical protein
MADDPAYLDAGMGGQWRPFSEPDQPDGCCEIQRHATANSGRSGVVRLRG